MHPEAGVVPYLPTGLWHSPFTLTPPHAPDISSIYAPSMPRGVMTGTYSTRVSPNRATVACVLRCTTSHRYILTRLGHPTLRPPSPSLDRFFLFKVPQNPFKIHFCQSTSMPQTRAFLFPKA